MWRHTNRPESGVQPEKNTYFAIEPLCNMVAVGKVGPHAVRLWLRSACPGNLRLHWWREDEPLQQAEVTVHVPEQNERDNTLSVALPDDFPQAPPLMPLCCYRFRVMHETQGYLIGEGRFETAPAGPEETPQRFAIALMSCHQPFTHRGKPRHSSVRMLRAVRRCLQRYNIKLVLTVGDQMYADYPTRFSLFNKRFFARLAPAGRQRVQDCTSAEIRRLYHMRYRVFWSFADWQAIHAEYPCYPILDDHEIVDNWGSDPAHQTPAWRAVGVGARAAYSDYQDGRVQPHTDDLPESFHYAVQYGHTAIFVMDLRSTRRLKEDGQLFSDAQEADLLAFLRQHCTKKLLCIVLSVPLAHLPRWVARVAAQLTTEGEDFSDRWSAPPHLRDRDRFLHLLWTHQQQYPTQRLLLLSGDIHIGCVQEIRWEGSDLRVYQMVSSAITNSSGWLVRLAARWSILCNRRMATRDNHTHAAIRFLPGMDGCTRNPYGALNFGIIEIETPSANATPRLRLLLYGHKGDEPVCVYRSPVI